MNDNDSRDDSSADASAAPPALGTQVMAKVAEGCKLINNETGTYFEADVFTPQTVTITTLRRLQDSDLMLV